MCSVHAEMNTETCQYGDVFAVLQWRPIIIFFCYFRPLDRHDNYTPRLRHAFQIFHQLLQIQCRQHHPAQSSLQTKQQNPEQ